MITPEPDPACPGLPPACALFTRIPTTAGPTASTTVMTAREYASSSSTSCLPSALTSQLWSGSLGSPSPFIRFKARCKFSTSIYAPQNIFPASEAAPIRAWNSGLAAGNSARCDSPNAFIVHISYDQFVQSQVFGDAWVNSGRYGASN